MVPFRFLHKHLAPLFLLACAMAVVCGRPAVAQSAPPAPACNDAVARVVRNNLARVAAALDANAAIRDGTVFQWRNGQLPRKLLDGAVHVTLSADRGYAVDEAGRLLAWPTDGSEPPKPVLDTVTYAAAGRSGVLAIRCDGSLWQKLDVSAWKQVAPLVVHAWAGDGTDYYIDGEGALFVSGAAERGQYGDGLFSLVPGWTKVAQPAARVVAAGGHALYLDYDGTLMGAGDNGDGALGPKQRGGRVGEWSAVFGQATDMTTGMKLSAALRADGTLWVWGGAGGAEPRKLMDRVAEAAAGADHIVAMKRDGTVWTWRDGAEPSEVKLP